MVKNNFMGHKTTVIDHENCKNVLRDNFMIFLTFQHTISISGDFLSLSGCCGYVILCMYCRVSISNVLSWIFSNSFFKFLFKIIGATNWVFVCQVAVERPPHCRLVFCYQNCSYLLWEKIILVKTFEIRGWRPRICKIFEITRTI